MPKIASALSAVEVKRLRRPGMNAVPLSGAALELLAGLPRFEGSGIVFTGVRGGPLSDNSISKVCRSMGVDAVPHGFRSSFRDWCAESTNYPREVAEMALAHTVGNKVEAAYRRGDLFEKRRRLMADWAKYLNQPAAPATVTTIRGAR